MNRSSKVISLSLAGILTFSGVLPSLAKAEESINTNEVAKEQNSLINDSSIKVLDSGDKNIRKVELTYDNETVISEYNVISGEIFVDNELFAIITEDNVEVNKADSLTPIISLASSYPVYNIGTPGTKNWTFKYAKTQTISFLTTQFTTVAVSAALVVLFFEDKPSRVAAGIISAATTVIATLTTNDKLSVRYTYSVGTNNTAKKGDYMQDIMAYKGSALSGNALFRVNYYTGYEFR